MASRLEQRLEHEEKEAKPVKVGEEPSGAEVPAPSAEAPGPDSPGRSPKRWKSDGHMRYKREAEVSVQELAAERERSAEAAEGVSQPATPADIPPVIASGERQ